MRSLQKATLDEIRQVAARLCRDYLTGKWKVVSADQLVVKRISGGLSNFLYYVSLPEDDVNVLGAVSSTAVAVTDNDVTVETEDKNRNHSLNNVAEINDLSRDGIVHINNNGNKRQRTESIIEAMSLSSGTKHLQQHEQQQKAPREVLLRVYGQTHGAEDALESMIAESVVFALLSERNFGPKLLGIFPGGRIEQYIPARPLLTTELSDYKISKKVAEKMGEIHSLNIPMSKEPDWLWNCMNRWLKSIPGILKRTDWNTKETNVEMVRSFDFYEETKWLKCVIEEENYPVLFCHNDLQEGNILFKETDATQLSHDSQNSIRSNFEDSLLGDTEEVNSNDNKRKRTKSSKSKNTNNDNNQTYQTDLDNTRDSALSSNSDTDIDPDLIIIDFEYCAYNYRGFDLANHFLEWTFDYTKPEFPHFYHHKHQYPTNKQRENFINAYLKKLNDQTEGYVATANDIQSLEQEVRLFSLFSHLFWSLWSVVNVTSNIEFGYWDYAVARIQEYKTLKQVYVKDFNKEDTTTI